MPDFRGQFLRGVDGGAGNDPDASSRTAMNSGGNTGDAVGSIQADELASHTHDFNYNGTVQSTVSADAAGNTSNFNRLVNGGNGTYGSLSLEPTGGNETRPKNAYVNFIIKE